MVETTPHNDCTKLGFHSYTTVLSVEQSRQMSDLEETVVFITAVTIVGIPLALLYLCFCSTRTVQYAVCMECGDKIGI
jgi:hypothetical protein